jgi:hypothetical protein
VGISDSSSRHELPRPLGMRIRSVLHDLLIGSKCVNTRKRGLSRNTSLGMGYLHSKLNRSRTTVGASNIITRLMSQSLTGHSLPPQVHQHYDYEFHIILKDNSCIRSCYAESTASRICTQLERSALEGLHSCVFDDTRVFSMSDKVEACFRADPVSPWFRTPCDWQLS